MKKLIFVIILILALVLSGCNFPGFETDVAPDPDDAMATESARILTGTPMEVDFTPTPVEEETEQVIPTEPEDPLPEPTVPEPTVPEPTEPVEPEEPTPTPAPTETPVPTPTATLAGTDPAFTLGDPDWVDNMNTGENWFTGDDPFTKYIVEDGFFKLISQTELYGWRLAWPLLENFYIEYTLQSPNCSGDDSFGIFFRAPRGSDGRYGRQGYLYGITCDGRYNLRRWDGKIMHSLIDRTAHDAIQEGPNVVNKLGVMARGANLAFYINGQKVDDVNDSNYLNGKFGIFVGGTNVENLSVWVDQVRYWTEP